MGKHYVKKKKTKMRTQTKTSPVLKVDAHGAHVRETKESWGDQKAG